MSLTYSDQLGKVSVNYLAEACVFIVFLALANACWNLKAFRENFLQYEKYML